MAGRIIPVSRPIDNFIGKIFKGFYREHYDIYMLSVPENYKDQPMPPIWKLF